jgi:hypothetical protein
MHRDPSDLVAKACAELGLSHQLEQFRVVPPCPSKGGSSCLPCQQLENVRWQRKELRFCGNPWQLDRAARPLIVVMR